VAMLSLKGAKISWGVGWGKVGQIGSLPGLTRAMRITPPGVNARVRLQLPGDHGFSMRLSTASYLPGDAFQEF